MDTRALTEEFTQEDKFDAETNNDSCNECADGSCVLLRGEVEEHDWSPYGDWTYPWNERKQKYHCC